MHTKALQVTDGLIIAQAHIASYCLLFVRVRPHSWGRRQLVLVQQQLAIFITITGLFWNPYLAYVGLQLANGQRLALSLPLHQHRLLPQLVLSRLQLVSALRAGQSHLALHISLEQGLLLPQSCHLPQCLYQTCQLG